MSEKKDFVYICGSVHRLSDLAADPALRAELLEKTKRKRAIKQYRNLVRRLAEHDAAGHDGVEPLILRRLEDGPERSGRQQLSRGRLKPGHWGVEQHEAAKRLEEKKAANEVDVTLTVVK